jgi:hypothetical protein
VLQTVQCFEKKDNLPHGGRAILQCKKNLRKMLINPPSIR